jgi:hypothetical protein
MNNNNDDKLDIFYHNFPQFGFYRFNKDPKQMTYFKIGDPPNNKRRHDKFYDLSS